VLMTSACRSEAVTSPDQVVDRLNGLVGTAQRDVKYARDAHVKRVVHFDVVDFHGSVYVIALTEAEATNDPAPVEVVDSPWG
jgi:hypothetical protein